MKPILTVVHIYYPELWSELKKCLANITVPYDLYVTTVEKNAYLKDDVLKFKNNAHFEIVENRGYDVGPFIHTLKQVNLDQYSYLIKLHTKRDIQKNNKAFRKMYGSLWRNNLLLPYCSKENFQAYIKNFEKYPDVGMQGHYQLFVKNNLMGDKIFDKYSHKNLKKFLEKKGLKNIPFIYIAGTMFMVRAPLFKQIQQLNLTLNDFHFSDRKECGDIAHILERFFGYTVYNQGYILRDTLVSEAIEQQFQKKEFMNRLLNLIQRFFYQKKYTLSEYTIIKILKIPVYRRKHVSTD